MTYNCLPLECGGYRRWQQFWLVNKSPDSCSRQVPLRSASLMMVNASTPDSTSLVSIV